MMLIDKLNELRIILASNSPRRKQLLHEMGLKFDVIAKDYDESYPDHLAGPEIALYVAGRKAESFRNKIREGELIITADTIVWCNNKVLGKPGDNNETIRILREISGNTHEVITGVSILSSSGKVDFCESTRVTFEKMTDEELMYYAGKYNPVDKAGAYGIQEWIGIIGCSRIEGSYFNVVGLPVHRLYSELKNFVD